MSAPPERRLLVLVWTKHFFGDSYLAPIHLPDEGIHLEMTTDRDRLQEADAVWFHGASTEALPREKHQPWILMSMESDENYPALKDPYVKLVFNLHMTYRLDSDIPCIYPNRAQYGSFLEPPPERSGPSSGALATYIASNPVKRRDDAVRALMEHIPVDCLGDCLNNKQPPDFVQGRKVWGRGGWQAILSVLPTYKFYLAYENSRTTDYVTERVFHALAQGVVPVYLGAPNVRDFMPDDDAIIVADDFDSPRALAEYLVHLDHDDEAYNKHLRWKREGLSESFQRILELGGTAPRVRMARKLAHGCDRSCRCGGRARAPGVLP